MQPSKAPGKVLDSEFAQIPALDTTRGTQHGASCELTPMKSHSRVANRVRERCAESTVTTTTGRSSCPAALNLEETKRCVAPHRQISTACVPPSSKPSDPNVSSEWTVCSECYIDSVTPLWDPGKLLECANTHIVSIYINLRGITPSVQESEFHMKVSSKLVCFDNENRWKFVKDT